MSEEDSEEDFGFSFDDLVRLLPQTEVRRGRGRKCKLTRWLEQNREEFGRLVASDAQTWGQIAKELSKLGITDGNGKPFAGERLRKAWVQVNRTQVIQPPQSDKKTVATLRPVTKASDPPKTDSHDIRTDPRSIRLLADLNTVEATEDATRLFKANRLEKQLKSFQKEHEGSDSSESVTQFVDEFLRRLSAAREDYLKKQQLEKNSAPFPERPSQAAVSVPPTRPTSKPGIPEQYKWHSREEYEAQQVKIDWDGTELRCTEIARKLKLSSNSMEAFQVKQELLSELNAPNRMLAREGSALGRIPDEIATLYEQPESPDRQELLARHRIRQEVLQQRADKGKEFAQKWMACLDEILDSLDIY